MSPLLWPASLPQVQPGIFPAERVDLIRQGLHHIYSLEHGRAAEIFQAVIGESPEDPTGYTYLAFTYWLQELSGKQELSIDRFAASDFFSEVPKQVREVDPAVEARFRAVSMQAIERARRRLAHDPNDRAALFLLGLAYQNLASFEAALKRNWWSAFRWGARTYQYHRELLRQDPSFYDARISTGVYNYVAGSLAWNVKWLAFLMGYSGSKERGKQELLAAAEKAVLMGDDARVILVLIYTRERNYQAAFDYLGELLKKYPQNYLVHLDMGGIALRMNRPPVAIRIYEDILRRNEAGARKYAEIERASLYNRLGVAHRQAGELAASAEWLHKALKAPGVSVRSATIAHLELGKTLDLMGQRGPALEHYRAAAQAADIAGSRPEAEALLRRPFR